jgi:hypothetical protein
VFKGGVVVALAVLQLSIQHGFGDLEYNIRFVGKVSDNTLGLDTINSRM